MKNYTPRLFNIYKNDIQPLLMKKLNIKNVMELPRIDKIVLNIGMGEAKDNKNSISQAVDELMMITGQKPIVTKAKHAISNFKIRAGDPVGVMSTLRGVKMYEFLDRFISISSPRIRDFRGFSSKGFDGRGNYNFGISEQIIFPEIDYDKVKSIRGMNITIVTNSDNDNYTYELLIGFGFPIKELKNNKSSQVENIKEIEKVSSIEKTQEVEEAPKEETVEAALVEETPAEESPAEETTESAQEVGEALIEETAEVAPKEEVPVEESPAEETVEATPEDERESKKTS